MPGWSMPRCTASPGKAGEEDFDLSNHYDAVIEREQREAALGWTRGSADGRSGPAGGEATDRDGSPLHGASVAASARASARRTGRRALVFHGTDTGRYVADAALPAQGQWELTLSASAGGHDMAATRRVIVH